MKGRRRILGALVLVLALAALALAHITVTSSPSPQPSVLLVENPSSGLRTWEVGTGTMPLVLLHGYGAAPQEWLPFSQTIVVPASRRFVFPQGPEVTMPPDGPPLGRAWWRLGLASYRSAATQGLPDMSRARPEGLDRSARRIQHLLGDLRTRLDCPPERVMLGGFSQGAMISAELAFRSREPLQAIVLLSGTPVDEESWLQGMRLRRGLPVFIAHGRHDDVLPFSGSARLQQTMRDAGLEVTWVPFEGGHETPVEVVVALNQFLARLEPR